MSNIGLGSKLLYIYFGIVSLFALIGTVICTAIVFTELLRHRLITPQEYLDHEMRWVQDQCKYDDTIVPQDNTKRTIRSEEAQQTCINEREQDALLQRGYDYKNTLIQALTRGVVFLFVFGIHFWGIEIKAYLKRYVESPFSHMQTF